MATREPYNKASRLSCGLPRALGGRRERNVRTRVPRRGRPGATGRISGIRAWNFCVISVFAGNFWRTDHSGWAKAT